MYIPKDFNVQDTGTLHSLIRQNSFGLLVTTDAQGTPFATHLPFLLDEIAGEYGTLRGHVARANTQWQHFAAEREVLVVFPGPHAYISPSWYETQPSVPTWNYVAVHAYGVPALLDEPRLNELLYATVAVYEGTHAEAWQFDMPPEYVTKTMRGIVGFEIPIRRLEGKRKLSQNRSEADRKRVISALMASGRAPEREMAEAMLPTESKEELS